MPSNFCHFEIYYTAWYDKFVRTADPIVLFIHWSMIQNRFKCFYDSELHDQLPQNWLNANGYYDFHYKKYDLLYRLEIYIANDSLFVQLRSLVNFLDSTQYIKIADFIDVDNYKNNFKYKTVYKDLDKLYSSIKWSIDHFRSKKPPEQQKSEQKQDDAMEIDSVEQATTCSVSSSSTQVSKKSRKETKKNLGLICDIITNNFLTKNTEKETGQKLKPVNSYNELINHIKQEKAEFDMNVESFRRNSACSSKSSEVISSNSDSNLIEPITGNARKKSSKRIRPSLKKKDSNVGEPVIENPVEEILVEPVPEEPKPCDPDKDKLKPKINREDKNNVERDKINRNLLFDYNPITNYFFYNKRTDQKNIDQKILEEDEFVKQAYKKFNLVKFCEIKLIDCFKTDLFKGLKAPIKLSDDMKGKLNLAKQVDDDDEYDDIECVTKSNDKKKHKKRNIWRTKRRAKSTKLNTTKKSDSRVKSNESSPLILDSASSTIQLDEPEPSKQTNDLMNFFKTGTLKRKRSVSSSPGLPNLDVETKEVVENEMEKSFMSPVIKLKSTKEDSIFKKLNFTQTQSKSTITIEKIDKNSESNLSINLFGDKENGETDLERPSKRTRKESEDEELVDLDTSIEVKDNNGDDIKSPWKSPSKRTPAKTPLKTPEVLKSTPTPKRLTEKFKDIANRTMESISDIITPKKFYKNFTSTQKIELVETTQVIMQDLEEISADIPQDKTVISKSNETNDDEIIEIEILDSARVINTPQRNQNTTRLTRSATKPKQEPI